ncbi:uncharacterized protein C7orf57 homolog isoform X2 [Pithys albifrons albifrons]|uniref:uncharacterized protein C7orf57 homolog isoform X2 n=1 Tax=Pithys albifrons albifrons TaxID=3385563 RepID=UPI003A5CB80F
MSKHLEQDKQDLLKHYTSVVMKSPPAAYAAPDWYLHHTNPPAMNEPWSHVSSLQEYRIHREFKADYHRDKSYEARRGPFDFDTKSVWQRDAEDKEIVEKKKISLTEVKLPAIKPKYPSKMPNISTNKEFSGEKKLSFPPIAQRKSEAGTNWFQQCTAWEKEIQETSENSEQTEDSEPSRSESPPARNELKPPFQGCDK